MINCKYCGKLISSDKSYCSAECSKLYRNSTTMSPYEVKMMATTVEPEPVYVKQLHPNVHPSWTGRRRRNYHGRGCGVQP